ncbi:signal peptidase I [Kordia sp.]|uniref:signal peptidase I n=1 Tax=Kordia sp. TaxID=1965332 RepID=UPI003D2DA664
MSLKKRSYKKLFFSIGCILILLFLVWSSLILISIVLLFLLDSVTLKILANFIKKKIPSGVYQVLTYVYSILLFVIVITFVRTFFFDIYYVPSSSMEKTLLPGNYVLVNKITYGTKIPANFGDIPVVGSLLNPSYTPVKHNRYRQLKAFKDLKRNDIVVFKSVEEKKNTLLIKRLIGMPGDTLQIKNTTVFINEKLVPELPLFCYRYVDHKGLFSILSNREFDSISTTEKNTLQKVVYGKVFKSETIFPASKKGEWTVDNYGAIVIPKKGLTITLTKENIALYQACIRDFENEENVLSNQNEATYTFKQNYYFAVGDNRHNSIDSRMYGFIPERYIQGKMVMVLL